MSNINPQSIDGTYPIAGQDNNSQGFRDNFTSTVNNFTFAAAELTDLQQNAVLKAALGSVGQTGTPTNDMNYAYLTHAQLKGTVETKNAIGNVTTASGLTVDWSTGHWQTAGLTDATTTMAFASTWPAATAGYTKLRLQLKTYANVCALTLPSSVTNASILQGYTSGTTVSLPAGSVYLFEFSTDDAGSTVTIQDLLRNYDAPIDFTSLNVTGNLSAGLSRFAAINSTPIGNAGPSTGAFSTLTATGNVIAGLGQFAAINSTPIGNASASTGTFTTLSATGNLSTGATHVETGYQQVKPTANVAVTVSHNVNRVLLHPTGSIISFGANVTLPNVQVDGTIVNISSNVTIASLDVRSGWNGVVAVSPFGNVSSVTAGTNTRYMYIAADYTWYKIA